MQHMKEAQNFTLCTFKMYSKLNLPNPLINLFTLFQQLKLNTVRYTTFQHTFRSCTSRLFYDTAPAVTSAVVDSNFHIMPTAYTGSSGSLCMTTNVIKSSIYGQLRFRTHQSALDYLSVRWLRIFHYVNVIPRRER